MELGRAPGWPWACDDDEDEGGGGKVILGGGGKPRGEVLPGGGADMVCLPGWRTCTAVLVTLPACESCLDMPCSAWAAHVKPEKKNNAHRAKKQRVPSEGGWPDCLGRVASPQVVAKCPVERWS